MTLSHDYIRTEEDVIRRNETYLKAGGNSEVFKILNSFLVNYIDILNIGSGGYMPILVHTTHALDVSKVAEEILRKNGWKGNFTVGSCTELPFLNDFFEAGVCAEVLEHLPTHQDVVESVIELDRVCRNWIVSVPAVLGSEPDHKRVLKPHDMEFFCNMHDAKVKQVKIWYIMWKGDHDPVFPANVGHGIAPRGATHG